MIQRRVTSPMPHRSPLRGVLYSCVVGLLAGTASPAWAQADPTSPGAAARPPSKATGHSAALKSGTPVTVNFVNADIDAVTRAMATMIQRQIAVDPRVKGAITLYSEQPLTVRRPTSTTCPRCAGWASRWSTAVAC